jgi:hypothetical protein
MVSLDAQQPMFPIFRVIEGGETDDSVVGTVTRTTHGSETWVGDGWIAILKGGVELIRGRWHRKGDLWEFAPKHPNDRDAICAQREWEVLDSYWGERAEIVLDETRQWDKARFRPTDAIRIQGPAGAWITPLSGIDEAPPVRPSRLFPPNTASTIDDTWHAEAVEAGWDHEHCAICWETLGPDAQAEGYVSEPRTWVCEQCYNQFVERRSLEFIPSA